MAKKLSFEYVKDFIQNEGYKLVSKEYINNRTHLDVMCPDGHLYKVKFNVFQSGSRCPKCSRKNVGRKYDYKYVKKYIEDNDYLLLSSSYDSCEKHLDVMCSNGHTYKTTFSNFKSGFRCKECKGLKKYTFEDVKTIVESKDYKLISNEDEYNNVNSYIKLECDKGHIYKTKFSVVLRGFGCPYCSNLKIDYYYVKEVIEKEGYTVISDTYINNREKLDIKCPNGHIFKMSYNKFQYGCRCTVCSSSNGEQSIAKILYDKNIEYIPQYRFYDCKYNKTMPFDFYIPSINLCIEYDGIQHFEPVEFFGGETEYNKTKIHDQIKNDYCKNNNIKLIRIPYWEFDNIESILIKEINI